MQDKQRTRHKKPRIHSVPSPIPEWGESQRIHRRAQRRIYGWPLWVKFVLVLAVAVGLVLAGAAWSGGRSSVLAEQLAEAESEIELVSGQLEDATASQLEAEQARAGLMDRVTVLEEQIAAAPDQATVNRLESQREAALERVEELDEAIIGWQGRVATLEGQVARLEQSIETQREMIRVQANQANTLQRAETQRITALPGQIVANLAASPPYAISEYQIVVGQDTLSEAFGQRFWGWLDEFKSVTARGQATFIAEGTYSAENAGNATEVKIPLPAMVSYGLNGFTSDSFDYEPGWLATVNDQDVSDLMVWVENNHLVPEACADSAALLNVAANAEAQVQSVAGERQVVIVWISQSGQEFTASQLTNAVLMANAC